MISPVRLSYLNNINFSKSIYKKSTNSTVLHQNNAVRYSAAPTHTESEIKAKSLETTRIFQDFLRQKGKVTQEEYDLIKKKHPEIISRAKLYTLSLMKKNDIYTSPKIAAKLALTIDSFFNNDNKIISVGTSPSFITESLSAMGKDITFIPISTVNQCRSLSELKDYFEYYPNLKKIGKYLKYKGINKEEIKDKNVIILDFASTGRTIHILKRLVNEYCGIPSEQIEKENLSKLIALAHYKISNNEGDWFDWEYVAKDIDEQKVENMSNTPHFSIYSDILNQTREYSIPAYFKKDKTLFKQFEEFSRPSARAYQLCVLDEIDKLKNNSKREQNEN